MLWFTDAGTNAIGRVSTSGIFTEYPLSSPNTSSNYITVGPDGALWFTQTSTVNGNEIGRLLPP
jgi:virginiamycin B lyase